MAKVALLIGVSEYEVGLNPLPAAVKDVLALERILKDSEMGDFDEVKTLTNPEPQAMQYEVETLFSGRSKDDFVLLFFSGHGIKDDSNNLYFATRITRKSAKGDLIRSTAVPARFVHEVMNNSRAKRQAIILDCCFSGAFDPNLQSKDDGSVDLQGQLGAEGRVVLTSSSSTQYSFEQQGSDLSLYTRYLIEGIETGAGDLDEDGKISVQELHKYAKDKVQETAPSMTPKLIILKDLGFDLVLAKAKVTDPKLRYRRQVERHSNHGAISSIGRTILDSLQTQLGLSAQITKEIEIEVLRPYQERLKNIQRYQQAFEEAVKNEYPFSNYVQSELEDLLEILGIRHKDVDSVEQEIITRSQATLKEYQQKSQRYEEEFRRAVELEYPLTPHARNCLDDLQKSLGLESEDVEKIERPLLAKKQQQDVEKQKKRKDKLKNLSRRDFILLSGFSGVSVVAFSVLRGNPSPPDPPTKTSVSTTTPTTSSVNPPNSTTASTNLGNTSASEVPPTKTSVSTDNPTTTTNTSSVNHLNSTTASTTSQPKSLFYDLKNGVSLDMVYIPSGKFTMGSLPEGENRENERPQIEDVNVSAFRMGKYEVTQAQWQAIMGNNPAKFQDNFQNPVESVSWDDAQEFCKRLSQKTGKEFRLPSEAEWEYACRAGTITAYFFGDNASLLSEYAWYDDNSDKKTHPVGQKNPNSWDLYDMYGNVWEWCQDSYEEYGEVNNLIRKTGKAITKENNNRLHLLRGGSWDFLARVCRSAYRNKSDARLQYHDVGFRVVCVL